MRAWVDRALASAPPMTEEQMRRTSIIMAESRLRRLGVATPAQPLDQDRTERSDSSAA